MNLRLVLSGLMLIILSTQNTYAQIDAKVDVLGLDSVLEQNVRLFLSIEQQKNSEFISEGRLKRLHKKAPEEISKALQPYGFYRSSVSSELNLNKDKSWHAIYRVTVGKPIPVGIYELKVDESISQNKDFSELIASFSLKKGSTFNHLEYEKFKADLARLAAEQGYFKAQFRQHRVEVDLTHYQANIYLNFEGGTRYNFGDVVFSQYLLDEGLLRRYASFKKGDPYSVNALIALQQALNDADYFSKVEVSPGTPDTESHVIPVDVLLKPRKKHRISVGLGYGTDTGERAKLDWQLPRYNTKGHKINTQTSVSKIGYSLGAQYSLPILNPRTDQLIYSAGIVNEKTDTSESTVDSVGISLKHGRGKWRENISLNYQLEDYIVAESEGKTALLMPGINWSRIWGERWLIVFDGMRLDLGFRFARKDFFSDVDFSQVNGQIKSIHRLNQKNRFILRGKLGRIYTGEFEDLPSSIRFFAGGAQSVRGYRYQSLGPVDDNGDVIGGQYLVEGSAEYEYSFNQSWGVALFVDAGNAIEHLDDELKQGVGFGMRWNSPIGPVRIDLASALSIDGNPWRLHINIGPDL